VQQPEFLISLSGNASRFRRKATDDYSRTAASLQLCQLTFAVANTPAFLKALCNKVLRVARERLCHFANPHISWSIERQKTPYDCQARQRLPMPSHWLLVIWIAVFAKGGAAAASEWARFRGPNGSGVHPTAKIPIRWTEKNYNWKVKLPGPGHSSPVVWSDRIFITCGDEKTGERTLLCFRAKDGKRLWTRSYPGERHGKHSDNSFASATPAVDERHVYVCWGSPKQFLVVALDHHGKEKWRVDLGPYSSGHGFGASPIIHRDTVVVPDDQDARGALYGLDQSNGKTRWKVPRRSKATYTTPCVYQPEGGPAELIFTNYEHGITSVNPNTGHINWAADVFHKAHVETAIGSPIIAGDLVLASCGWLGVRQEVIAVRPPVREQKAKPKTVFTIARGVPLCTTPLAADGLLFLWGDRGVITCADANTGKVYWRERVPGSFYASPVCAARRLYSISREGDVFVIAAAKQFKLLARNPVGEGSHSSPAIANGCLYLRTFRSLISIAGKDGEK
jgi:outer membrane protein assembly factor BamB